jgi:hypothetical protein
MGCERLSVHDGLLTLRGIVCTSWVVCWRDEYKFCGGGWCKWECVGRQKDLFGSCLVRVTSMHDITSIRMFEDDVS